MLTVPALFHKMPTDDRVARGGGAVEGEVLVVPESTSLARAWTNVGVAAAATCAVAMGEA
jgi:hypothetical protein